MKLAYLDLPAPGGVPAVVLHREAAPSIDRPVGAVRATGLVGRVVVPFGDYAYYPSGMESGGTCWYRMLPGYAGTDPISLAKAVVQVCDLLDDLSLERPMVVGFGQGAVVALGAGLVRADRVGSVVAVDPWPGHVPLLPAATRDVTDPPPVLLATTDPGAAAGLDRARELLATGGVATSTWCWSGEGDDDAADRALADGVRRWSASAEGRPG